MMRRLTFVTGFSLLFMLLGLVISLAGLDGAMSKRFFFIAVGVLGWFIGNDLVQLNERVAEFEKKLEQPAAGAAAAGGEKA